ncbi:hypothetical protein BMS3Bbin09_00592 [bacterium BMS3Bbin09]|nr:hypothetical protein BMS3Bbin09_00592 [bacterium BMS3Bbin09]
MAAAFDHHDSFIGPGNNKAEITFLYFFQIGVHYKGIANNADPCGTDRPIKWDV